MVWWFLTNRWNIEGFMRHQIWFLCEPVKTVLSRKPELSSCRIQFQAGSVVPVGAAPGRNNKRTCPGAEWQDAPCSHINYCWRIFLPSYGWKVSKAFITHWERLVSSQCVVVGTQTELLHFVKPFLTSVPEKRQQGAKSQHNLRGCKPEHTVLYTM